MKNKVINKRVKACFLVCDRMLATSLTLPVEMLSAAESIYTKNNKETVNLQLVTFGLSQDSISTMGGLNITPDIIYSDVSNCDLIILPALWRNPVGIIRKHTELMESLRLWHKSGCLICASGTGVFFLAMAKLLDEKPATTHWHYLEQFRCLFPQVILKPNHLITQSGQIYCSGSINSIADLMVYLIGILFDLTTANMVEQQFSPEVRKPFNDMIYSFERTGTHTDETVISIQQWLQENFNQRISMRSLSQIFSISQRTLNRRFIKATGIQPLEYLNSLRIKVAKDLLKNTNLSITEVALNSGFYDLGYFSKTFKEKTQLTPSKFKASIRGKMFQIEN